jgi:hypothetical protein
VTIDMSTFNVSLRTPGNNRGLSATVRLEDERLAITAGEHEIGEWSLSDLHLEATGTGYRMMAEGELVILDFESVSAFERELAEASKSRKGRKRRSAKEKQTKREKAPKAEIAQETVEAETAQETVEGETESEQERPAQPEPEPEAPPTAPTTPPRTRTTRIEKPEGDEPFKDKVLRLLDNGLASAEEKAGALLPAWVFTRGMAASLFVLFVLALVFPGLASTVLFILGAIVVILGAIAYSDDMLASRWLPGRATPTHVLIAGVVFILLGVLFALIAR